MINAAVGALRNDLDTAVKKAEELEGKLAIAKLEQVEIAQKLKAAEEKIKEEKERSEADDGGRGGRGLSKAKEGDVEKLKDGCTRAEFKHWRHCVEMHLEKVHQWKFWSRVLIKIRAGTEEVQENTVDEAIIKVNQEAGKTLIDEYKYNYEEMSRELYVYLIPKLNTELATLCHDDFNQNGFEVYRKIHDEKDTTHEDMDFHLEVEIQGMGQHRCGSVEETNEFVKQVELKTKEYREKTGKMISEEMLARVVWQAMDKDTAEVVDSREVDKKSFKALKALIQKRFRREESRRATDEFRGGNGKGLNSIGKDTTTKHDEEETKEEDWVESGNHIDLTQKGKGKGGKGGLQCYGCGGDGHPQRMCPSRPEVQAECFNCGGKGHFQDECPSPPKGKGKGKSGGGGFVKGNGGKDGWSKDGGKKGFGKGGKSPHFFGKGSGNKGSGKGVSSINEPWMQSEADWAWTGTYSFQPSSGGLRQMSSLSEVPEANPRNLNRFQALGEDNLDDDSDDIAHKTLEDAENVEEKYVPTPPAAIGEETRRHRAILRPPTGLHRKLPGQIGELCSKFSATSCCGGRCAGEGEQHKPKKTVRIREDGWNEVVRVISKSDAKKKKEKHKTAKRTMMKNIGNQTPDQKHDLNILTESRSNPLSSLPANEWSEIEVTVDSGACDTVMPEDLCNHISIVPSAKSQNNFYYEVANGEEIPNLGERQCLAMTPGGRTAKRIHFQVASVHKPLLSITKCADMGFDCVLQRGGGYLYDNETGEAVPIERKGNLYVLKMWVKQAPPTNNDADFTRRG